MAKKKIKKTPIIDQRLHFNMKNVTTDKCETCRLCERGIQYLERMSHPGAVGYGVPCILTKGKAYK